MREEPTPRGSLVSRGRGGIWSFYDNVIGHGLRGVHGAAVTVGVYRTLEWGGGTEKRDGERSMKE